MKISVLPCEWGDARRGDIQHVLQNVASHIEKELRDPLPGAIEVENLPGRTNPRTHYRNQSDPHAPAPAAAYRISLTAKDNYWSQFAYQFAHEFCHVLSGYERLHANPNEWLHESICEMASIFVLRRMGKRWRRSRDHRWIRFAPSHSKYADNLLDAHVSNTPSGSFRTWLLDNEADLRANSQLRDINGVVAAKLLPNFEQEPSGWNAVRLLPATTGCIQEYIESWRSSVDTDDRDFVEGISARLGFGEPTM